jgi:uncharacterized protein
MIFVFQSPAEFCHKAWSMIGTLCGGDGMLALLANAGLIAGLFIVLMSPALFRRANAGWMLLAVVVVLADFLVTAGGADCQDYIPGLVHAHWNWFGKILSIVLVTLVAAGLSASGKFRLREMGLSFLQAPGTLRAILFVAIPAVAVQAVLSATLFGDTTAPARETILFQASMPGLSEELAYRGVILALLDRAFTGRFSLGGAKLGYGAIAVTLFFGLIHGIMIGDDLQLHTSLLSGIYATLVGFLLVWLRLRTGSIVVPVFAHNALNVVSNVVLKVL